ncbi:MAG: universal stress protein, partial [Comamonadaceae bacterium]|nr:universal stress protein [Comamonadaceae bacterium]
MFKRILVPTDGSDIAQKAANTAAQLAKSQGAEIVGVYVIDPFPYIGIGDASAAGLQAYLAEAKNAAGQALDA